MAPPPHPDLSYSPVLPLLLPLRRWLLPHHRPQLQPLQNTQARVAVPYLLCNSPVSTLGVFQSGSLLPNFVVVGGFSRNLIYMEDRLAVEIYNPDFDSWQLGPPLSADFRSGNSSQSLSSALFKGSVILPLVQTYSRNVTGFYKDVDALKRLSSLQCTIRSPSVARASCKCGDTSYLYSSPCLLDAKAYQDIAPWFSSELNKKAGPLLYQC